MEYTYTPLAARATAIYALAVVGFITVIGASIWFAAYSTRYIPSIVNRAGSAAVYLSSFFTPAPASLSVVPTPTASTTLPFATTTEPVATSTPVVKVPVVVKHGTTPGQQTNTTYPLNGTYVSPTLSGLPDLVVTINAIGYLASASTDSFIASSTVPHGSRPAVKFTIKNSGTNTAGAWRFNASIPTQSAYIFESEPQQQLAPNENIEYVLGFDQATTGAGKMISITANPGHTLLESNTDNNSAAAYLTILGS